MLGLGVLAAPAEAASGDLDPTFGVAGRAIHDDPTWDVSGGSASGSAVHDVVVDPHTGQIYVVGTSTFDNSFGNSAFDNSVVAYNPDGTQAWAKHLEPRGGPVEDTHGDAATLHPLDGSLVIAGWDIVPNVDFFLYVSRVAPDGTLLNQLASGTWQRPMLADTGFAPDEERAAVAVAPDGDVIVGATLFARTAPGDSNFALVRFDWPSGELDQAFGTNGLITTDLGDRTFDRLEDLAVQPDGKIVAVGSTTPSSSDDPGSRDFAAVRYTPTGALDPTFAGDGVASTNFPAGGHDEANAVALQPDGKIVLGGTATGPVPAGGNRDQFGALRYHPDGSLDAGFGTGGQTLLTSACSADPNCTVESEAHDVAVDQAGRIILGGYAPTLAAPARRQFALTRLLADGTPDPAFGTGGLTTTVLRTLDDQAYGAAVAVQPDDKVLLAGHARPTSPGGYTRWAVARYLDGQAIPPSHTLTVTPPPAQEGSVTSSPFGITCPTDCTEPYPATTTVQLTAVPAADFEFAGWTGDCAGLGPCTLDMSIDHTVGATFARVMHALTVTVAGQGRVTSTPGIDCPGDCTEAYTSGSRPALTAIPAPGWEFTGWTGDCTGTTTCNVTMDADRAVGATFSPLPSHALTVAASGQGAVTSNPAGIDCPTDCGESYPSDSQVALTATAAAGWSFTGWAGDCSGLGPCQVAMAQDRAVTATFTQITDCTITGTSGNDQLVGTAGDDRICGLGGNDTINGGPGNDLILGGPGSDALDGGSGNDRISGGSGNDTISGGLGDDQLEADDGNDIVDGGLGNDTMTGGNGNDTLSYASTAAVTVSLAITGQPQDTGGAGTDQLNDRAVAVAGPGFENLVGTAGEDALTGGDGPNVIGGGGGNDVVRGGGGLDVLVGGDGNDSVLGEAGSDLLNGQAGNDALDGGPAADFCNGGPGTDTGSSCEASLGIP